MSKSRFKWHATNLAGLLLLLVTLYLFTVAFCLSRIGAQSPGQPDGQTAWQVLTAISPVRHCLASGHCPPSVACTADLEREIRSALSVWPWEQMAVINDAGELRVHVIGTTEGRARRIAEGVCDRLSQSDPGVAGAGEKESPTAAAAGL